MTMGERIGSLRDYDLNHPPHYWKLVGENHVPVPCESVEEWGKFFEGAKRHVADFQTENLRVSTVFLGLDHNFSGTGLPVLFETMVFGGPRDQEQRRYCTWEEAQAGHDEIVKSLGAL